MNLVTIDDKITRLKEHSVSIEVVERVDRTCFYTAGSSIPLEHDDENILWLRGQYLLDSDEVKAARSAVALGDKKYEDVGEQKRAYEELLRGGMFPNPAAPGPVPVPFPAHPSWLPGGGLSYTVTVLDDTGKLLMHARWGGERAHAYRYGVAGWVSTSVVPRPADEGVTWCRGHVSVKDDVGKALLVSAALAPEKIEE